jgi:phosphatidylserine decarboxylase
MKIHREGHRIIFIALVLLLGLNVLLYSYVPEIVANILILASIIFFILIVQFFRDPKRNTVLDDNNVIAPADGKVVVIEEAVETEFFNDKRIQVSIFMSPLNVHVNRNPISGTVKYAKYHPGKYLVAWHPKSSTENERTTVVIDNGKSPVLFRQIAGAVARRIVMYSKEGQDAVQGREMGFIKFGSRIDLFLPLDCKINVNIDQKTVGGETVVASFH